MGNQEEIIVDEGMDIVITDDLNYRLSENLENKIMVTLAKLLYHQHNMNLEMVSKQKPGQAPEVIYDNRKGNKRPA